MAGYFSPYFKLSSSFSFFITICCRCFCNVPRAGGVNCSEPVAGNFNYSKPCAGGALRLRR